VTEINLKKHSVFKCTWLFRKQVPTHVNFQKPVFVTQYGYALSGLVFVNEVLLHTLTEIITIHIPIFFGRERSVFETHTHKLSNMFA
jgi:hypothetical protein